ncbi:MAG: type II toxin-antitoxin system prevent-host-death family antitoxin [Acidimicrobiia bacterium]|nr:type II toxin-antitoxin system prevent-host-death family antitoxin [Acidimicrobiia bacterium]
MNVGICELKAHLSEYVKKGAAGEQIIVTDRGRPVAKLEGIDGSSIVEKGIAEGWITPSTRSGLTPAVRYKSSRRTMEVIDEDRE